MAAVIANASGDATTGTNATATTTQAPPSLLNEASGPMGDAPQKRPLEDGEEPGPKKLASLSSGVHAAAAVDTLGMQQEDIMSETMKLPDDLVGLIIGRGGENIMRMQRETGCRIQITQSIPGTKDRPCTLSGTPEQIEVCRNMLNEIINRSQAGTLGSNFSLNSDNLGGQGGMGNMASMGNMGGMGDGVEKTVEISIPPDKCGLIIGKGGETIKMLQQSLGVKMLLIQDSTENLGQSKPLRITGLQVRIDNAVGAIHQMMAQRDSQIAQQKMDQSMFGEETKTIPVPKAAVGVVIGKSGDMINQIQNVTGTRIQFKPEDPNLPERICSVVGPKEGVDAALRRVNDIIQNVQERDAGNRGCGGGGGGGGGGMGGPPGGMGGFGQWEGPNLNRGGRGVGITSEEHLVPANKTGLVIGKGGETIKQINMQSQAHAEIQRNPPPGSDLNYKTFIIKGTPEQIKVCRQLIQEKVDARVGGGMGGGPMGGPPGQVPPGNYGPPPQQGSFGGLPPGASYAPQQQNPLQAPPQGQPAPSFQQQQPWGNQFQQWNPPAATTPQQNGGDPTKPVADNNSAAWQSYLQLYGQAQPGYQQPAASAAPAAAAVPSQPDYSKQWDEYLKQTGVVQAAAAAAAADRPITVAPAAAALQQQVAATTPTPAAGQPATTQADYSAAWAEYYRHYYHLQGQQYAAAAAAAGQAPAPN